MGQISGPLTTVAHLGNYILEQLHDIHIEDCIGQNMGVSANKPKQDLKRGEILQAVLKNRGSAN